MESPVVTSFSSSGKGLFFRIIRKQKHKEVSLKLEKLEEKLVNDKIEPVTYKKWYAKLAAEKGVWKLKFQTAQKRYAPL